MLCLFYVSLGNKLRYFLWFDLFTSLSLFDIFWDKSKNKNLNVQFAVKYRINKHVKLYFTTDISYLSKWIKGKAEQIILKTGPVISFAKEQTGFSHSTKGRNKQIKQFYLIGKVIIKEDPTKLTHRVEIDRVFVWLYHSNCFLKINYF